MTEASMMQQQIRLGFRTTSTNLVTGLVNTGILVFVGGSPTSAFPATRLPVSQWCTFASDNNSGSSFKFTRKGIYDIHAAFVIDPGAADVVVRLAMSVDSTFLTASILNTSALTAFLDFDQYHPSAAGLPGCLRVSSTVSITNAMRSSNTYSTLSPAGTSQLGTVRFHGSQDVNGDPIASRSTSAAEMWCNGVAELFG